MSAQVSSSPIIAGVYALAKGREHFIFAQHLHSLAAQLEGEDPPVPLERLVDVVDLQGDVVDAHESGRHGDEAYVLRGTRTQAGGCRS